MEVNPLCSFKKKVFVCHLTYLLPQGGNILLKAMCPPCFEDHCISIS